LIEWAIFVVAVIALTFIACLVWLSFHME